MRQQNSHIACYLFTKRWLLWMLLPLFCFHGTSASAQTWETLDHEQSKLEPLRGLNYMVEAQGSFSKGKTPLWLNANKYGLSSLDTSNGYLRASVSRALSNDSTRRWGVGYGVDMALTEGYTSRVVLHQAYAQVRWLHGTLSFGSMELPMELKNTALSSGSQTLGINSRPIPQVRLALPDYWILPFGNGWVRLKGHIAYGWMTDENWQHSVTNKQSKYADGVRYHSKAGYIMIGNPDRFYPFSVEMGLEMGATFGGTAYRPTSGGTMEKIEGENGLSGYWHVFVPGGAEAVEEAHKNTAGNQVGSWVIRANYDADTWRLSVYADKYFEDHSAMFLLDFDGYGSGAEWNKTKKHKFIVYDLHDIMLGAELELKQTQWINHIVAEYIYTKYQSGPFLHEHSAEIPDHIGGNDNYYNHYIYTGWQHWGQVIGNPLYRSPIYNNDGTISVENSRFMAFYLALAGEPTENFAYKIRASYQDGLGTYQSPYTKVHHNVSFSCEGRYQFSDAWSATLAYGMDFGHILGHNAGASLTITHRGKIIP